MTRRLGDRGHALLLRLRTPKKALRRKKVLPVPGPEKPSEFSRTSHRGHHKVAGSPAPTETRSSTPREEVPVTPTTARARRPLRDEGSRKQVSLPQREGRKRDVPVREDRPQQPGCAACPVLGGLP